jgi:hypothetical protein
MKKVLLSIGVFVFLLGILFSGLARAADFTAWTDVWFKVNAVETGLAGLFSQREAK